MVGNLWREKQSPGGGAGGWPVVSSGGPLGRVSRAAPLGLLPACWADSQSSAVEEWTAPSLSAAGQTPWDHAAGPLLSWTQMDQRGVATGRQSLAAHEKPRVCT